MTELTVVWSVSFDGLDLSVIPQQERLAMAASPQTEGAVLAQLCEDLDAAVSSMALRNPNLPRDKVMRKVSLGYVDVWGNPCLPLMFIDDPHRMKPMAMLAMKVAMQGGDLSKSCVPKKSELPELLVTTFRAAWDAAHPVVRSDFLHDVVNITGLADCMRSIDPCVRGYCDVLAPPWLAAECFASVKDKDIFEVQEEC